MYFLCVLKKAESNLISLFKAYAEAARAFTANQYVENLKKNNLDADTDELMEFAISLNLDTSIITKVSIVAVNNFGILSDHLMRESII